MPSSVLTRKSQITIPKAVREEVGLKIGDRVSFRVREGEIVLRPPAVSLLDLQGSVDPRNRPEDFHRMRKEVKRRRAELVAGDE